MQAKLKLLKQQPPITSTNSVTTMVGGGGVPPPTSNQSYNQHEWQVKEALIELYIEIKVRNES